MMVITCGPDQALVVQVISAVAAPCPNGEAGAAVGAVTFANEHVVPQLSKSGHSTSVVTVGHV